MDLFIRIENGSPVDHPITLENLQMVYPGFDPANPPENFMPFVKLGVPYRDFFEVYEGVTYIMESNYVTETHHVRPMTSEEKQNYINDLKQQFIENGGDEDWYFDENLLTFVPSVPYPTDGQKYMWDKDNNIWILDNREITYPDLSEEANVVINLLTTNNLEINPKLYELINLYCEQRTNKQFEISLDLIEVLRDYQRKIDIRQ